PGEPIGLPVSAGSFPADRRRPEVSEGIRMMKRSVRGMAKVSVVWMIVMVVAFLAAIVMFFVNNGELDNQIKLRESAETARKAAEIDTAQKNVRDIGEKSATDLADLRRQLADSEQQKQDLQSGYEKQLAEVRDQFKNANVKVTEANTKIEQEKRRTEGEKETL